MRIRKVQQPAQYPANNIYDAYTESNSDTYCCNYINELNTYSEDEIRIGTFMGKPLYRKVYTGTKGNAAIDIVINEADKIINFKFFVRTIYGHYFPAPSTHSSANYNIYAYWTIDQKKFTIEPGSFYNASSDYYGYIEYTKTTD